MDRIYKSYEGHVVVRVAPGGMTYEVFVLDDKDAQRKVIAYFGPYRADLGAARLHCERMQESGSQVISENAFTPAVGYFGVIKRNMPVPRSLARRITPPCRQSPASRRFF